MMGQALQHVVHNWNEEANLHSVFEFVNPILIHFLFPFTYDFKHMEDHNAIHLGLSAGNKQYVYIKWEVYYDLTFQTLVSV